jgi:hypothetical protein
MVRLAPAQAVARQGYGIMIFGLSIRCRPKSRAMQEPGSLRDEVPLNTFLLGLQGQNGPASRT